MKDIAAYVGLSSPSPNVSTPGGSGNHRELRRADHSTQALGFPLMVDSSSPMPGELQRVGALTQRRNGLIECDPLTGRRLFTVTAMKAVVASVADLGEKLIDDVPLLATTNAALLMIITRPTPDPCCHGGDAV